MSELPRCPFCGATLWEGTVKHTEEGTKLTCDTCGSPYIYIPGYGSFALPELGQADSIWSSQSEHLEILGHKVIPSDDEVRDSNDVSVAKACCTLCCLLSSVPFILIMVVMVLISLF